MKHTRAVTSLAALAHQHRLAIFRLLVKEGPSGMPAGEIADHVGASATNTSFHL
jgi:ArsR family transcriptional regulator, arsenate/arsenite/antimonite-responsive transcriptional repressor